MAEPCGKIQESGVQGAGGMIFVTVGTEKFPFDRLLKIVDSAVADGRIKGPVFAQIGSCSYKPKYFPYTEYLSFDKMQDNIRKADIVVGHAGVGTMVMCLDMGKIPIIFPRRASLREHVDDHQFDFTKQMESTRRVIAAYDETGLIDSIRRYAEIIRAHELHAGTGFDDRLKGYLREIIYGK